MRAPVMVQHWRWLTFLHWRYPAEVLQARLPAGLTVETYDGAAWLGLIPFQMTGVRPPGLPPLPWLSRFAETNLRTYVRGPDGRAGIWFFSLDAARLLPVLTAQVSYGLPYRWSAMAVRRDGPRWWYRSRRRWPGPAGAGCEVAVEVGAVRKPAGLTERDHFLTARFRLYSRFAGRLVVADADHGPWPLRPARLRHLRQDLTTAAGLPPPVGEPLVHASDGVMVRISRWRRTRP